MLTTIGQMLPLVTAGALSSVPIAAVLTLLLAGRGAAPAALFAAGYLLAEFGVTAATTVLFGSVLGSVPDAGRGSSVLGIVEILLGCTAAIGGIVVLHRPGRVIGGKTQSLTARLAHVQPAVVSVVGIAMAFRPKSLLLAAALGLVVGPAGLPPASVAAMLGAGAVVSTSTVVAPVAFALVRPEQARSDLRMVRLWLSRNAHAVTIVVLFLIASVLVGDGFGRT